MTVLFSSSRGISLWSQDAQNLLGVGGVVGRGLVLAERLSLISLGRRSLLIQKIAFFVSAVFYSGEICFTIQDLKNRLTVVSLQEVWQRGLRTQDWIRLAGDVMLFCWSVLSVFTLASGSWLYVLLCDIFCAVGYGCSMHVKALPLLSKVI